MPVRIKVARTAEELDDVFRLRHEVYVGEEGYFKEAIKGSNRIVDRFDSFPDVANIIAYSDGVPVGTLRINRDSELGLPPDEIFDFSEYRQSVGTTGDESQSPVFVGAGMLAIASSWRNRRDVFRSLFKMAAGVADTWGVTHILATVNAKTQKIYHRLGFESMGDEIWVEEIGEFVVPMTSPFRSFYEWAFGDLPHSNHLLESFSDSMQRLVCGAGESLFREGDPADEAYLVDEGNIKISRQDSVTKEELALVTLHRGDLFGEISLIDDKPRSANASALTNSELIVISRDSFLTHLREEPARVQNILQVLAERLRQMDDLAVVLAYGSAREKLKYALGIIRGRSIRDKKHKDSYLVKIGPYELAQTAGVSTEEAEGYLIELAEKNELEFSNAQIRFKKKLNKTVF